MVGAAIGAVILRIVLLTTSLVSTANHDCRCAEMLAVREKQQPRETDLSGWRRGRGRQKRTRDRSLQKLPASGAREARPPSPTRRESRRARCTASTNERDGARSAARGLDFKLFVHNPSHPPCPLHSSFTRRLAHLQKHRRQPRLRPDAPRDAPYPLEASYP